MKIIDEEPSCKGCDFYNEEDDICEALDCNVLSDCDSPLPCEVLGGKPTF